MKLALTAYRQVLRLLDTMDHKAFLWTLVGFSLALHAGMALAQQGKYWWDTIAYFELARAFFEPAELAQLYAGDFGIVYTHIMPGVPFVIRTFDYVFGEWMFLAIVVLQVVLNAIAIVYFVTAFVRHLSRSVQIALIFLLSLNPYYAAFHNALLTESISSSMLLVLGGAFVRGIEGAIDFRRAVTIILIAGFIGTQFRLYFCAFSFVAIALLVLNPKGFAKPSVLALALACSAAPVALFPAYRAWAGAGFFLPHTNALMLTHASYVAWDLPPHRAAELQRTVKDPLVLNRLTGHAEMDVNDTIKIAKDLEASGLTRAEMGREILRASWGLRLSSWPTIRRQVQGGLQSLGFQLLIGCCSLHEEAMRGYTRTALVAHAMRMQQWNSGTAKEDYLANFDAFAQLYRQSPNLYSHEAAAGYVDRVRPFVSSQGSYWRDPLFMARIPPDLLALSGLAGLIVLARKNWKLGWYFATVAGAIYAAVVYAAFIGDNRYSHALIPIYFVSAAVLGTEGVRSWHALRTQLGSRLATSAEEDFSASKAVPCHPPLDSPSLTSG